MKWILTLLMFFLPLSLGAKEIAISFDDMPRRLTGHFTGMERAKNLVKQLKEANVKSAVFYANSAFINEKTKEIVEFYNNQGFKIANHTHSHPDFNKTSFDVYKKDFLKAKELLSPYSQYTQYFRYPYLKEGQNQYSRDDMRTLLKKEGYINAYITVDFSDWHLEDLYRKSLAANETVNMEKLKALYISLAKQSLEHYDTLAKKHLGRSPKHVLLLHETDLAALFIKDLVDAMRSWGWKIISSEEAYTDPIANFQIQRTLKYNPGRIGEIAIDRGHPMGKVWAPSTDVNMISARYQQEVVKRRIPIQ
jgi:peptidoglycan/xylan/chitin deacetylase (PgdA/CDA1 family)